MVENLKKNGIDERETELRQCIKENTLSLLHPQTSVCIAPETRIREVIERMVKEKASAVLIVENEELIGIFSERDLLRRVALDYDKIADQPIRDYMTHNPIKLSANDPIAFALHHMDVGDYRHIPITDERNIPAGLITVRDIIWFLDHQCLGGPE